MADARLGGAAFIASVNADQLVAGLNKAEGKVKDFGKKTKDVWDKIGERFGGGGGGFIAKALGAGFFGGIAGSVAIRLMDSIREGISSIISEKAKWKRELEGLQLGYQILDQNIARTLARHDEMRDAGTREERGRGLVNDILGTEGELAQAQAKLESIADLRETIWSVGFTNASSWLSFSLERKQAFADADFERAQQAVLRLTGRLDELREAKKRLDPNFDPAVKSSINAYIEDLDKKVQTMGMSAEEAALKLLKLRGGPKDLLGKAGDAFAAFEEAEKGEKFKKLTEEAAKFTKELEKQFDNLQAIKKSEERLKLDEFWEKGIAGDALDKMTLWVDRLEKAKANEPARELLKTLQLQRMALGMSANEAKLLELRLGGAAKSLVETAGWEAAIVDAFDEAKKEKRFEPKLAEAMLAGSKEAFGLEMRHNLNKGGTDPNKGVSLWDINVALLKMAVTLQKIEAKTAKAGVL